MAKCTTTVAILMQHDVGGSTHDGLGGGFCMDPLARTLHRGMDGSVHNNTCFVCEKREEHMEEFQTQILDIERQITRVETELSQPGLDAEGMKALRREKEQLRREKEQVMEKELILLRQQQSGKQTSFWKSMPMMPEIC